MNGLTRGRDLLKKQEKRTLNLEIATTRHVLQRMDLGVFRPLKLKWDEVIVKW